MALPEHSFPDDFVLEPADVTPEVMEAFGRHVMATERTLLTDIFREQFVALENQRVSQGEESDIFRSIFEDS
jgi:hypothetical protein